MDSLEYSTQASTQILGYRLIPSGDWTLAKHSGQSYITPPNTNTFFLLVSLGEAKLFFALLHSLLNKPNVTMSVGNKFSCKFWWRYLCCKLCRG